uniref:hypothetical protein n=1 Tax=Pyramidobacter sp. CG50-2 TaxID=2382160 RepID=UPI001F20CD1E|nr:hypothetical protein [Pyramidobacter sp. CG50-2]
MDQHVMIWSARVFRQGPFYMRFYGADQFFFGVRELGAAAFIHEDDEHLVMFEDIQKIAFRRFFVFFRRKPRLGFFRLRDPVDVYGDRRRDLLEQLFLALEIAVDEPDGDLRFLRDILHFGASVILFVENADPGAKNAIADLFFQDLGHGGSPHKLNLNSLLWYDMAAAMSI